MIDRFWKEFERGPFIHIVRHQLSKTIGKGRKKGEEERRKEDRIE